MSLFTPLKAESLLMSLCIQAIPVILILNLIQALGRNDSHISLEQKVGNLQTIPPEGWEWM